MDPDDVADQIAYENEHGLPWDPMDDETESDQFMSDGDALASAGMGTNEDYGFFGGDMDG